MRNRIEELNNEWTKVEREFMNAKNGSKKAFELLDRMDAINAEIEELEAKLNNVVELPYLSEETLETIKNLTAANRREMMEKIAKVLNGKIKSTYHSTFERASDRIFVGEYIVNFDFSKGKVKCLYVDHANDKNRKWYTLKKGVWM